MRFSATLEGPAISLRRNMRRQATVRDNKQQEEHTPMPKRLPKPHERTVLTFKESASYLRVSESTLRLWINDGKVFPSRLSKRKVVFLRSELDRFLEESKQPLAA